MTQRTLPFEKLASVAKDRGDPGLASEIAEAAALAEAKQFTLAALGQFKRGKSTLLNALIGRPLLPMDVAPLTSIITVLAHGVPERSEVLFQDGRRREIKASEAQSFVTEEGNPGNALDVQAALFHIDAPLLAGGMRLVDTPGVGSVFGLNSAVTKAFLPRIDVALIVLGGDPPITGDELELVRAAVPRAGKLLFVMNKADLLDDETKAKAEAFSRKVLSEVLGQDPGPFLCVSARRALRGEPDPGVIELKAALGRLVTEAGAQLAALAEESSIRYFADRLLQAIALEQRALLTPLEEMEGRIQRFKRAVQDVEDLALAVQGRLARSSGYDPQEHRARSEEFLQHEQREGVRSIHEALIRARSRTEARRLVQPMAEDFARQSLGTWLQEVSEEVGRLLNEKSARMADETRRLAVRVEQAASECFNVPLARYDIRCPEPDFERIPFEFVRPTLALDPQDWLYPVLESLLPGAMARGLGLQRARALLQVWLRTNLHAIEARRVDVLDGAVRALQQDMVEALRHLEKSILVTLETGIQQKSLGEKAVAARLSALARQEEVVDTKLRSKAHQP
ncbi:MAG: hypothetical protein B7X11_02125 [Acidobacteria bacterium 37-65-4]|nr:MAG: hypothetical protein B7X11_02125 [Acidobacteria bacterium 37-65-4]